MLPVALLLVMMMPMVVAVFVPLGHAVLLVVPNLFGIVTPSVHDAWNYLHEHTVLQLTVRLAAAVGRAGVTAAVAAAATTVAEYDIWKGSLPAPVARPLHRLQTVAPSCPYQCTFEALSTVV